MSYSYVLDSYAVLAYLQDEQGSDDIERLLSAAGNGDCLLYMCLVNLGEVIYTIQRKMGLRVAADNLMLMDGLAIDMVPADRQLCLAAAHLKAQWPVAYGDCFAAALSQLKNALLVTGDPEFRKIRTDPPLQIQWLR